MSTNTFCKAVVLALASSLAAVAADKHPFSVDDWAALRSARPIVVAPDGATILYRVDFGGAKGPTNQEWRLIDADGTNARKLDVPEHFTPYGFARDGAALYGAFEVNRVTQLAILPLTSGAVGQTPSVVIMLPSGIHSAVLSPDGSRFAVLASPRPPDPLADVHAIVEPDETSLYVVNRDGTGGTWWCSSLKNIADSGLAGSAVAAWSPDGSSLALLSQTPKIGFHEVRSFIDVCSAAGPRRVVEIRNAVSDVAWADGGRQLVFLSTTSSVLTPDHVWTVSISGGTPIDRSPKLDGSATGIRSDAHGNVWVLVNRGVQSEVDSFRDDTLTPAHRWPSGVVQLPANSELASAPDRPVFTVADPEHVENLAVLQGGTLRKITTESDEALAKVDLGPVRAVKWTSKEGTALEGIATFPAGYTAGRRDPFLVLPHGGPESNDTLRVDFFARLIAGLGYVVLQPEYRGSTGYGTEFLDAIYQHFGDRAYPDVDSATDFAISQGWADPNRLAIFGWSAGGFMTSWTITQTPRYRVAIEGAGITDWASFMWTSDVQQIDYDGRWPEENPNAFLQFSAVAHASQVTTPLLVLHGSNDLRVPTYQGREFFEALAAHGKTTRMVTYPGSGHFPGLWEQRRDVFREVAAWLGRHNP
jgi:dipeptidyl aminopeptidase/acylaminoacyl peptidase